VLKQQRISELYAPASYSFTITQPAQPLTSAVTANEMQIVIQAHWLPPPNRNRIFRSLPYAAAVAPDATSGNVLTLNQEQQELT
jgi:hypothetical protein